LFRVDPPQRVGAHGIQTRHIGKALDRAIEHRGGLNKVAFFQPVIDKRLPTVELIGGKLDRLGQQVATIEIAPMGFVRRQALGPGTTNGSRQLLPEHLRKIA